MYGLVFASALLLALGISATGCGGQSTGAVSVRDRSMAMDLMNHEREIAQQPPLVVSDALSRTAAARAARVASGKVPPSEETPLPRLIAAGCYARFALSHGAIADDFESAMEKLVKDPLGAGKISHGGVTHVGIGTADGSAGTAIVIDLARMIEPVDTAAAAKNFREEIDRRRELNGSAPLTLDENLDRLAREVSERFMAGGATSDAIIADSQKEIEAEGFALGRVTIAFQVADSLEGAVIPERVTDPSLAFMGIGVAQGNHPDHDPGAIAMTFFLAEPQTANSERRVTTDIPPPKAVPIGKSASRGTLTEQAWLATLTGNHKKAARMFEKAYRQKKAPSLLYEAARAHARNKEPDKALEAMRDYARLVEGDELTRIEEIIAKLERGESIFEESRSARMSLEAKRFFVLGQRLFDQEEWAGAIDAFQQAYTYAPAPEILYNIGLAHLKAGKVGTALDFFAEYQRLVPEAKSPDEAKQLFMMGVELYRVGQFEAAARRFAMAYAVMPIPDLVYNLALCHKAMGEKDQALKLLREFLDSDPSAEDRARVNEMIAEISD